MAAQRSKKRKVDSKGSDEAVLNEANLAGTAIGNSGRASSDATTNTSRAKKLAELVALETEIDRLHDALDTARDVLRSSRYEPDLDAEALRRVVDYAHRTCYIAAPPGYIPGESQLFMMRPPAPQPMQLQQSILHTLTAGEKGEGQQLYGVAGGAGEAVQLKDALRDDSGRDASGMAKETKTRMTTDEEGATHRGGHTPKPTLKSDTDTHRQQAPEDMVEVLKHMPKMPPGWKPGDPIPGLPTSGDVKPADARRPADTDEPALNPPVQPPKKTSFALGLEVDDLDFGLGSSSSSDSDSD